MGGGALAAIGAASGALTSVGLGFFALSNGFQTVLLSAAAREQRHHVRATGGEALDQLLGSAVAPRVSILAPAFNEAATIAQSVRALLTLAYPRIEVVVVNDGSSDATLDVLRDHFGLQPIHPIFRRSLETRPVRGLYRSSVHPELVVVDKVNGGKADALNAALNVVSGQLVCALDADTLIEADALLRIVRPFLYDERTIASGGTIRVANASRVEGGRVVDARVPRQVIPGVQAVEYLRAFLFGRLGWNRLGGNLIVSGAFGLFRRESLIAGGGYANDTVGEDVELVARVRRRAREDGVADLVEFVPDPVAWTEVPESARVLGRQRDRWQRGLADVLWRHRSVIGRPRYGALGLVATPYFLVVELFGPVFEVLGLLGVAGGMATGSLGFPFVAVFTAVAYGWAFLLSMAAALMEQLGYPRYRGVTQRLLLVLWSLVEHVGYRQLTVVWRLRGMWRFALGRADWGTMSRRGFRA